MYQVSKYRKEMYQHVEVLEKKISNSQHWIAFCSSLNEILDEKYKMNSFPSIHVYICSITDRIRISAMAWIDNKFVHIFSCKLTEEGYEILDLFSEWSILSFRGDRDARKYEYAKDYLVFFIQSLLEGYYEGTSEFKNTYLELEKKYTEEQRKFEKLIEKDFATEEFKEEILSKLDKYFAFSHAVEFDFSVSLIFDSMKYEGGKIVDYYDLYFIIGKYGNYKRLSLGSFHFSFDNPYDRKFEIGLFRNSHVVDKNKINGRSFLNRTVKQKLNKMIDRALEEY